MAKVRRRSARPSHSVRPVAAAARASANPSSTLVSPARSTAVRLDPMTLRLLARSRHRGAGPTDGSAHPRGDGTDVLAAGVDEEGADGVRTGLLGDVAGVGQQEAVARRGGELLGDTDVVELDVAVGLRAPVLQAQGDGIAGTQLEVVDGLGRDEDAVGFGGEGGT